MKRIKQLAEKIARYSCGIKEGERVVIQMTGDKTKPLVVALVKEINKLGANVDIINIVPEIIAEVVKGITIETAKSMAHRDLEIIDNADVCIMIKSIEDDSVMQGIDIDKMQTYSVHYIHPINSSILDTTRWISLRYPNTAMASRAEMSLEAFEDYYFKVCNTDYKIMSDAMSSLVELMEDTKKVRISGDNTDIEFSIDKMPVHKCDGIINLPDGEVYTAPVRDSVNGTISYNIPSIYNGVEFNNVCFNFKDGRIVSAKCDDIDKQGALEQILDMDEGARYIGEFALGVNPLVVHPTKDILFDEKIAGSFHLTPGFAYKDAYNGNESSVHWDLVCIQTKDFGGGEIYFDDKLVRKNGIFLDKRLRVLNPK